MLSRVVGLRSFARHPVIYFLLSRGGIPLYIGSTDNLGKRLVGHHIRRRCYTSVMFVEVPDGLDRRQAESALIAIFSPRLNVKSGLLWVPSFDERVLDRVVNHFFEGGLCGPNPTLKP